MNKEAYFNQERLIKVDANTIEDLKAKARANESGKYRLCMHHSPQDSLHEMLIVLGKGMYGRPGKHFDTTEANLIIEGRMQMVIFDEQGEIEDTFELSKDAYTYFRIETNIYHMVIPLTDQVVFHEIKLGPFTERSNVFPDWAPEPQNTEKVKSYMKDLNERIKNFKTL